MSQLRGPIEISATMIVVFCAGFAILWRQRDHVDGPATQPPVVMSALPSGAAPALPPQTTVIATRPALQAQARVEEPTPSQEETPAGNDGGPEMPVVIGIVHKSDVFRDRSTDFESVWKEVNEGIISSGADAPLTVTVIDTDVPTQATSQTTIVIAKGGQQHFGMHDGLMMSSGDQLTLRSPPYRDLIQQVP